MRAIIAEAEEESAVSAPAVHEVGGSRAEFVGSVDVVEGQLSTRRPLS